MGIELAEKLAATLVILWTFHEVGEVDRLIKYPKLTRFLAKVRRAMLAYVALKASVAVLEYSLDLRTGYFSIAVTGLFFVALALLVRRRRQRLADEWNSVTAEPAEEIYHSGIQTLETAKRELLDLAKRDDKI